MGLSYREVEGGLGVLSIDSWFQAIWDWKAKLVDTQSDPLTVTPSRVAVDETQIEVDGDKKWLYAVIDLGSKLHFDVNVDSGRDTDSAAAILYHLTDIDLAESEFLVDAGGYLPVLVRRELIGHLNYTDRNHIETWFQRLTMRIDRFHSNCPGSNTAATQWLRRFRHNYNRQRPDEALAVRTPTQ